ncbi:MAG: hypothetical protein K6C68_04065 [Ruminococcus sp.]|nr:hypothetical protein [Ruminococcus sp.]
MKTTTTNKKTSARKKLLPAAGSLLISAAMLSTSTYAWFTMNKEVSVTGMQMKTVVQGNLLISDNNKEADYTTAQLSQTRAALLEPVSSVSGYDSTFFYTTNAKGNGDAVADVYTQYNEDTELTSGAVDLVANASSTSAGTHPSTSGAGKVKVDDDFNTAYGAANYAANAGTAYSNAYGYVDYVFYLKATGDATDQYVKMTKLNMLYNNKAITNPAFGSGSSVVGTNVDRAWRAGVYVSEITGDTGVVSASNAVSGNLKAILTLNGAANQDSGKAVSAAAAAPSNLAQAYNTWSDTTNGSIANVANGETKYFKVTVRVWLEGEDTTCTSKTYAQLTNAWSLDCEFSLLNGSTAVSNIGSAVSTGSGS